ncbi:MAG TPA: hypothetical protein VGF94_29575 [Kofleriaceae bacterium]
MEIRRAEVAKKRPTWMLVVTGLAVLGIVVAGVVTVQKMNQSAVDTEARKKAEAEADQAVKDAKAAQEQVSKAQKDLEDLQGRLDKAISDVASAQDAVALREAQARLSELNKEKAEMNTRLAAAKAAAEKAERVKGVHLSQECLNNPLAKGCQ